MFNVQEFGPESPLQGGVDRVPQALLVRHGFARFGAEAKGLAGDVAGFGVDPEVIASVEDERVVVLNRVCLGGHEVGELEAPEGFAGFGADPENR